MKILFNSIKYQLCETYSILFPPLLRCAWSWQYLELSISLHARWHCIHCTKNLWDSWIYFDQTFLGRGLGKVFPARESLVSDIPAGDRNPLNLFYSVVFAAAFPLPKLDKMPRRAISLLLTFSLGMRPPYFSYYTLIADGMCENAQFRHSLHFERAKGRKPWLKMKPPIMIIEFLQIYWMNSMI
jgi:hypothetical protein